jgi:hypothetical protein
MQLNKQAGEHHYTCFSVSPSSASSFSSSYSLKHRPIQSSYDVPNVFANLQETISLRASRKLTSHRSPLPKYYLRHCYDLSDSSLNRSLLSSISTSPWYTPYSTFGKHKDSIGFHPASMTLTLYLSRAGSKPSRSSLQIFITLDSVPVVSLSSASLLH